MTTFKKEASGSPQGRSKPYEFKQMIQIFYSPCNKRFAGAIIMYQDIPVVSAFVFISYILYYKHNLIVVQLYYMI